MKQGWKPLSLGLMWALSMLTLAPLGGSRSGVALAAPRAPVTKNATQSKNNLRQFSGIVTALDKTTLTVEKRGKKPESRVFTRHAELRTTGELEQDARVTVYYRDEDGHSVAHRVVVKPKDASP